MSVIYSTALKNARMTAVRDAIDAGSGSGRLVIGTSALNGGSTGLLASLPLADPSGAVSAGVLTLSGGPWSALATGTGTAAKAEIRDSTGAVVVSGLSVGTIGANVNANSLSIEAGQNVSVSSFTLTHG